MRSGRHRSGTFSAPSQFQGINLEHAMNNWSDLTISNTPIAAEEPAPLVDEALAATNSRNEGYAELDALRAEVARLQDSLRDAATGAGRVATHELRAKIEEQPIAAAVIVAFAAFVYGATR
jgi:hypothetical protein